MVDGVVEVDVATAKADFASENSVFSPVMSGSGVSRFRQ
jgi:hypothetical protein